MLFNSIEFAIFFPVVTAIFFLIPHAARWAWLLAASCVFYSFFIPAYILILLVTIVIDYVAAIKIEDSNSPAVKKRLLILSILSTCFVLCFFKYYAFTRENVAAIASFLGLNYSLPLLEIILPIGLSFHTFQSLSYVIEVYRGDQKAERHFGIYSLYVMFYPQLVAGPIERPQNLLHQFHEVHRFDYERACRGLLLMGWGLSKKVLIADRLAPYVNRVYGEPQNWSGSTLWIATLFFAFQIYCDFSGYSDIARGSASVMGFRLMKNFDMPYFSASIGEFWRRWHISLSTWFKDYVFIPLGGSRGALWQTCRNLLITFVLSGLWHGANWTYIAWGALNGIFLIGGVLLRHGKAAGAPGAAAQPWLPRALRVAMTFFLINLTWVFFRAENCQEAFLILSRMFGDFRISASAIAEWGSPIGRREFALCGFAIAALIALELAGRSFNFLESFRRKPAALRWAFYAAWSMALVLFGRWVSASFIYFQF